MWEIGNCKKGFKTNALAAPGIWVGKPISGFTGRLFLRIHVNPSLLCPSSFYVLKSSIIFGVIRNQGVKQKII